MLINMIEVKEILQMQNNTDNDVSIQRLLKIIPEWLINYCNQTFANMNLYYLASTISFQGQKITDSASGFLTAGFVAGMSILIDGSQTNDGYYEIESVTASEIVIKETLTVEIVGYAVCIYQAKFPIGLKFAAAQVIGFILSQANSQGVSSESIGDYSVSYLSDLPPSIKAFLKPYRVVKWV